MGLFPPIQAEGWPPLVTGALLFVVAVFVFSRDLQSRLNHAFALLLGLHGLHVLTLAFVAPGPESAAWIRVRPYFDLAIPFAAMLFVVRFLHVHGTEHVRDALRRRTWIPRAIVAAGLTVVLLYAWDHALYFAPDGSDPLRVAEFVTYLVYAGLAAILVWHATASPHAGSRHALLLAGLGFGLYAAYRTLRLLLGMATDLIEYPSFWGPAYLAPRQILIALLLLATAAVTVGVERHLAAAAGREKGPGSRLAQRGRFGLALAASSAFIMALADGLMPASWNRAIDLLFWERFVAGAWFALLPILVGTAVLRYQLFNLDLRLRWSLQQSTVAGIFVFVYFVTSESVANYLSDVTSRATGILVAGLLLFLIVPLERWAARVAVQAMPSARGLDELTNQERREAFREQARVAWADGSLSWKERAMLDMLRERLGLSIEDAAKAESEVVGETMVAGRTQPRRTRRRRSSAPG